MRKIFAPALAALLLATQPAVAQDEKTDPPRDEKGRITDKSHPEYIRCRTEPVIGSRAKKRRVCLTNREWAQVGHDGNGVATRLVEDMRSGMTAN